MTPQAFWERALTGGIGAQFDWLASAAVRAPTRNSSMPLPTDDPTNPPTRTSWGAVVCMSLLTFVLIASEFMPVSLLTPIAGDLTITEGKVVGWNKKVGDSVTKGETVAEIETDKAVIAIEAPADGRLVEIVAPVETVVKLGETIGIVEPA